MQQDGTERLNAHQDENLPRGSGRNTRGKSTRLLVALLIILAAVAGGYLGLLFGYFPGYSGYVADNFRGQNGDLAAAQRYWGYHLLGRRAFRDYRCGSKTRTGARVEFPVSRTHLYEYGLDFQTWRHHSVHAQWDCGTHCKKTYVTLSLPFLFRSVPFLLRSTRNQAEGSWLGAPDVLLTRQSRTRHTHRTSEPGAGASPTVARATKTHL